MKKALIITSTAGFARGFLLHDMLLLRQKGYEVHCAANAKNVATFSVEELFSSLEITFHQIDFSPRSPLSKENLLAAKQVRTLLYSGGFDFIHCHTPVVGAIVRIVAAPLWFAKKTKIAYTTHGLAFHKKGKFKDKIMYGGIEWLCGLLCDAVITINHEDCAMMKRLKKRNVFHINGVGVDVNRFTNCDIDRSEYRQSLGVSDDEIMVLSVGELSERKNHQVIIKALAELKNEKYVFVLCGKVMEGNGTYAQLQSLTEELGVRTIFLGFRRDVPEITNCADIAILPSLREGLGLAGVEALASGVPVIGSDVQGIKDYVIDGETGFLCDPMNHHQIAEQIKILSDEQLRKQMRSSCIEKSGEFSTDVSYKQMSDIYNQIVG